MVTPRCLPADIILLSKYLHLNTFLAGLEIGFKGHVVKVVFWFVASQSKRGLVISAARHRTARQLVAALARRSTLQCAAQIISAAPSKAHHLSFAHERRAGRTSRHYQL